MWSRSMSMSASILCVTCSVNSEKPTARSKVPAGQQPAVGRPPEPDVVALGRIALDLLLVGEVLLTAEQEQRAHGRLVVAAARERRGHDAPARGERDVVGADPTGRAHRDVHGVLRPVERQVHGVAEQSVARASAADEVVRHVDRGEDAVEPRQHQVRQHEPEDDEERDPPPSELERLLEQQPREPHRGDPREHEEEPVEHRRERQPRRQVGRRALVARSGRAPCPLHACMLTRYGGDVT